MININPMLLCDFYKTTHSKQFPAGTTKRLVISLRA